MKNSQVNLQAPLEFEIDYYVVTVPRVGHNLM